jgi:hypothetical protein
MISLTKSLRVAAVCVLAGLTGQACAPATQADIDQAELEAEGEVASSEQALMSGGFNQQRLGYTCTGNTCECSKAIENDCEDMTAVCTDKTVDAVIACINGWATTHCVCTKATAFVRPTLNLNLNTASFGTATFAR